MSSNTAETDKRGAHSDGAEVYRCLKDLSGDGVSSEMIPLAEYLLLGPRTMNELIKWRCDELTQSDAVNADPLPRRCWMGYASGSVLWDLSKAFDINLLAFDDNVWRFDFFDRGARIAIALYHVSTHRWGNYPVAGTWEAEALDVAKHLLQE
ncbi:hypothetical protein [Propionibacterium freudenreichii]|uniref:hypothetical protein n=1 Tax=Propionibacterium freudenreichii TaxID=1744 RepID=UPI0012D3C0D5|nr:hypothetical protein [Propionibacterium freudenreichii]